MQCFKIPGQDERSPSLAKRISAKLISRFDEYASAVENDGAHGWRPIALKFLNALLVNIYAPMKRE